MAANDDDEEQAARIFDEQAARLGRPVNFPGEHPGAEHSTILRALDKWIMASHSLKKACVEKPGEGFGRGGGGGWGGLSAPGG